MKRLAYENEVPCRAPTRFGMWCIGRCSGLLTDRGDAWPLCRAFTGAKSTNALRSRPDRHGAGERNGEIAMASSTGALTIELLR